MRKAIAIAVLASVTKIGAAHAVFVPLADVPGMVTGSDLIVVGRAASVQSGPNTGNESFVVWVDRVIASSATPSRRLAVQLDLPAPPSGVGTVTEGQYGIFFLRSGARNNIYTATDPYHPALPATPGGGQTTPVADALTAVAQELTRVLTAPASDLVAMRDMMAAQYLCWDAASALETIPNDVIVPQLQPIVTAGQKPAQLWAIAILLRIGGRHKTAAVAGDYLASVKADLLAPTPEEGPAVVKLAATIQTEINTAQAVPFLTPLLDSKQVEVRRAAADALALIATPAVVAPLTDKALDDRDQDVRYYAVRGLAQMAGAEVPTPPAFYANEAEILAQSRSRGRALANATTYDGSCFVSTLAKQNGLTETFGVGYYACATANPVCGDPVSIQITCATGASAPPTCPNLPKGATFAPTQTTSCTSTPVTLTMPSNAPSGTYNLQVGGTNTADKCNYSPCMFSMEIECGEGAPGNSCTVPTISCANNEEAPNNKCPNAWYFGDADPFPTNYLTYVTASPETGTKYVWTIAGNGPATFDNGEKTISSPDADATVQIVAKNPGSKVLTNTVQVSIDGGPKSAPFTITVLTPYFLQVLTTPKTTDVADPETGYKSTVHVQILDQGKHPLPANLRIDQPGTAATSDTNNNWLFRDLAGLPSQVVNPSNISEVITGAPEECVCRPAPTAPGNPLGQTKVLHDCVHFYVGGSPKANGQPTGAIPASFYEQWFTDHGRICNIVAGANCPTGPTVCPP